MPRVLDICRKGHQDWYFRKSGQKRCRICDRETAKRTHAKHSQEYNEISRSRNRHLRMEVILAYGGKCKCCSLSRFEFLTIDHIDENGAEHRKQIGEGQAIYRWLKKNGYPEGFQVLCWNCNCSKHHFGMCPHREADTDS